MNKRLDFVDWDGGGGRGMQLYSLRRGRVV